MEIFSIHQLLANQNSKLKNPSVFNKVPETNISV